MTPGFTAVDWAILAVYVVAFAGVGLWSGAKAVRTAGDYFLAGHRVPIWLVAVSVLSTTQSAATFLGAPDYGYRGDYTYLAGYLGALLAAFVVAKVLMPRFYALNVATVYELLRHRYDARAMRAAGAMYLVGRVFASGARLYLSAIAVSMMVFADIAADHVILASLMLVILGIAFTFFGGLRSVVWTDLFQVAIYVGAAVCALVFLLDRIPAPAGAILQGLAATPEGVDKLRLFDFSFDLGSPFTVWAIFTGYALLILGNFGLDQDTTQRLLACKDARDGSRALYVSVLAAIPVVAVFMAIGSLLYVFYDRPDLMRTAAGATAGGEFAGEKITIFMHFILSELPPGLRGFVTVGVIAAAAVNSGLISMSSVLVQDFYRLWIERHRILPETHFVRAGQAGTVVLGLALFAMSALCYFWQRYTDTPLLEFVLSVMTFAYSGLLGVYVTAVYTDRGSSTTVILALATGFLAILLQQAYVVDQLGLPAAWKSLAFPWQLCIGTTVAFLTCVAGKQVTVPGSAKA